MSQREYAPTAEASPDLEAKRSGDRVGKLASSLAATLVALEGTAPFVEAGPSLGTATTPSIGERQDNLGDRALQVREAGRVLATRAYAPHAADLYAEKAALVLNKHVRGLTNEEERQLDYLLWKIHMVEDAEVGPSLDRLERLAQIHESLAETMKAIGKRVSTAPKTGRRGRR